MVVSQEGKDACLGWRVGGGPPPNSRGSPAAPFLLVAPPASKSCRPNCLFFLTHLSLQSPAPLTVALALGHSPRHLPDPLSLLSSSPPPTVTDGQGSHQIRSVPSSPASTQPLAPTRSFNSFPLQEPSHSPHTAPHSLLFLLSGIFSTPAHLQ